MSNIVATVLPYKVLASHVLLIILLLAFVFRRTWGREVFSFISKHAILLAFLVSSVAVLGSLFYSEIMGFEPCILCWWQRVLLYPLPIIFGTALWKKDRSPFLYAVPLAVLSAVTALYQSYTSLGGGSILPCTAVGGACSRVYVLAFSYITIPFMSLTIALYILLLAWAHKTNLNENSDTR
jgi:disulfide bond formation protein DsbB